MEITYDYTLIVIKALQHISYFVDNLKSMKNAEAPLSDI